MLFTSTNVAPCLDSRTAKMTDSSLKATFIIITIIVTVKDVVDAALDVNIPSDTIAIEGGSAVFEISYTESGGDSFNTVALNKGVQNVFMAPIVVQGQFLPNGSFSVSYSFRSSTNYYAGRTQFTITLNGVEKSDEGEYTVQFTKNINVAVPLAVTRVVLDVLPGIPSISGAPTQPVLGGAGPTVLTCTANLGKPQASMVWSRRIGSDAYTNITENITTSTNDSAGTTNGTSTLTVNLDTADDGVQFRCQVSNRQATLSAKSRAIKVIASVPVSDANIQVCKTSTTQCTSPFDYYINDQVRLTCGVTSSPPIPAPHEYKWYQHVNESSVISGPVLSFKIIESEIVYVCYTSNTVRGVTHTVSKQVTIRATARPTSRTLSVDTTTFEEISTKTILGQTTVPSPQGHKGLADAAVAGIAISVCLVVIVLIVLLVILIRRGIILLPCSGGNSRPNDKLHDQTSGNVQTADTVTYVNGMVRTGFPSTGHRNLDVAVADLLESLGLQSHAQAFEREQITAQSLAELTIEDLTLSLGVPLGPSRMMLKRIRTLVLHKQVDTNQILDGAYSDVGPPVYQEAVDVAYANVAQTPVYEGLADSTKGAQGDYAKLQGATMGDKPSEYETVMKTSQRR